MTAAAQALAPQSPSSAAAHALEHAREQAQRQGLDYAGSVTPEEAWALFSTGEASLVDVRTAEELHFVGRVPDALHVPWVKGTRMERNAGFIDELSAIADRHAPVLLLCRSGKRSVAAAIAARKAGFTQVFNILEGFEGDLDGSQQRGSNNGWRQRGLPWQQD